MDEDIETRTDWMGDAQMNIYLVPLAPRLPRFTFGLRAYHAPPPLLSETA